MPFPNANGESLEFRLEGAGLWEGNGASARRSWGEWWGRGSTVAFRRVSSPLLEGGPTGRALLPLPSQLPEWKIHGVQVSPGQQTFIAISGSPSPSKIPAYTVEILSSGAEEWGAGGCYLSFSAHCQG